MILNFSICLSETRSMARPQKNLAAFLPPSPPPSNSFKVAALLRPGTPLKSVDYTFFITIAVTCRN